ncbi:glycoside hydrolase family 43 protein [Flavobacterium sp. ENC]|uniref:glycoside hydrolase family 43 protein n=1 Tax=Flavobacterium sp. ENC TaxID=2897330 RepID=UPI001E4481B8|nr:glycoside hydrolase family 43 protein [Flavobacterium sp. ENC]MCD0466954.1 glycoside hydrolase family 43 protein [Flavobacterium sp. ENC]
MKKIVTLICLALIAVSYAQKKKEIYLFTSFREPATEGLYLAYSEDGYTWKGLEGSFLKPEIGASKIMRDPSIVKGADNTYHLVWTTDWKGGNGFGYASSKDLMHWSPQEYIPVMKNEPEVVNVWAPEIFYDDVKKEYIIIWASTIPFRFEKGQEEEKNNHRMYYVTTKDFKTFSPAKLYYEPGFSVIDCVIVKKGKKEYVLVLKDNTRPMRNIKVAFGKSALGPFGKSSEPFSAHLSEGPTVVKVDNKWLIYYDNYGEKNYKASATSDFVHFEDVSSKISLPEGHKHGTITTISEDVLKGLMERK